MSDGGAVQDTTAEDEQGGRFAALRRHWLLTSAVALALLATGTAVPLVLAADDDEPPCHNIPAATRALTDRPAAATRALDPGDDMARMDAVRELLLIDDPCGDGGQVLGQVVEAATRAPGPGTAHTLAQARAAFGVAAALDHAEVPEGMAPGVARMLADYVVDEARYLMHTDDAALPAVTAGAAAPDPQGWTRYGRFLAPGEAHTDFEYEQPYGDAEADPEWLVAELARDPEAFAILYDAERAYFAHYLERLTRRGGDPAFRPDPEERGRYASTATTWPDNDLEDIAERVGNLMKHRAADAREGVTDDLAAFDDAVRHHTRGTYRAAPRQVGTRPPMASIAARPVAGPLRGDLMDGRQQLFTVLDAWARERGVPRERAAAMRQIVDDAYVRGLWLRF
ncbi:hypothetical protein ABZZ79_16455 [Streptomyces sp. NPDC006458]|uniref:hypothetical protein n=1 Tax=Streptomyces sp. NPDC006458 TaxID=3154302 RepID=UPI0033A03FAC